MSDGAVAGRPEGRDGTPVRARIAAVLLDPRAWAGVLLAVAAVAAVQQLLLTRADPRPDGLTRYNNFLIFRQSFVHLVSNVDLYQYFPGEHHDNFLYSPTFAALMAPLARLPVWAGLVAWNLLNAAVLVLGIRAVPGLDGRSRALFAWFLLPEFLGSAQHTQTNPMIVGLLLLAFWAAETDRDWLAPLFLSLAAYVKIFPIVAGLAFLLYPRRIRLVLWTGFWMAVLALVPLLFVTPSQLAWQYGNWVRLHTGNPVHVGGVGITTEGILRKWLGLEPPRALLVAASAALTTLPLVRVRDYGRLDFRSAFLGIVLLWMIAFNHLSESPTFVIAMAGIALWYFSQRATPLHKALLWLAFLLVSVSHSDLVPPGIRVRWVEAWALKGVPVLLIWMVGVAELVLRLGPGPRARST